MGPISTKLGTKHPWMMGFKFVQIKGQAFFPKRDNNKNAVTKI